MDTSPVVSVVIPAYNAARYIGRTLDSVLAQTYRNLEIVIVDDGSADDTLAIAESYAAANDRIRVFRQANSGVAAARNLAIRNSTGQFVAPVDADDYWFPEKIEQQLKVMLDAGEDTGLVYSWWISIDENDRVWGSAARWNAVGRVADALLFINFIGNASVPLFRRTALDEAGLYNSDFRKENGQGCEDWDITLRVAERYNVALAPHFNVGYRAVGNSMSRNSREMARSFELMLQDLRVRRSDVDPSVIRWSKSRFYSYVASQAYNANNAREAMYWLRRVAVVDPLVVVSPGIAKVAVKSAIRVLGSPIIKRIWPTPEDWRSFRDAATNRSAATTLKELLADPNRRPASQSWQAWKPYDHILKSRWRSLTGMNPPVEG
ncbi:MAG: glycosyltransferase family A protein [Rhodothermales bacterium]